MMGLIFSNLTFSTVFLTISEKKLITELKKIKKYRFLLTFEKINLLIYNISKNFLQEKKIQR